MRRRALFALIVPLSLGTVACGPTTRGGAKSASGANGQIQLVAVDDREFAANAYQILLSDDRTPKREGLLAGVVQRQLARAGVRFTNEHREAGLDALTGALYLVRVGEMRSSMLDGGAPALRAGAAEVSRVGNEGRSLALYTMLRSVLPPGAEQNDVSAHLKALSHWSNHGTSAGPMQVAGALQRATASRALFEPSEKTLGAARDAAIAWVKRALDFNTNEATLRSNFEREEAVEAYRAVRTGGAALVALYLRFGDAKGALDALDHGDLLRVVPPGLVERLEHAAQDDDPNAWADLYRLYAETRDADRPETSLDGELGRAAAWGASVELFRSEPRSLRGAAPLATQLLDLGMAEVSPLLIAPALGETPSAQDLSWSMSLVLRAVLSEDEIDHAAARRTFAAAAPILKLAEGTREVGKVRPSAARLHYVMGALETRAGELGRARPEIEAAAKAEPTIESFNMLAAIDRQRGDARRALSSLDRVIALAKKTGDLASEAEALVTSFEIHRDKGDTGDAKTALDAALTRAVKARDYAKTGAEQARAERVLARVLEHFGAQQQAKRATERAYEASRADSRQFAATVLDASRRALAQNDLQAARQAVHQAMDAGLPDDDLVYVALWLRLVEQQLGTSSDGTAEEAFAAIDEDSYWPSKLAAWARGKLADGQLYKYAKTRAEQTEAKFYAAMSHRSKGGGTAKQELQEVAQSEAIELVEVSIARDLLARERQATLTLPEGVRVP
jgi:hypothetical protein